jgi:hypothetical protein
MGFEIGQKVVCVNGKFEDWVKQLYTALPVEGRTYVIRDVRLGTAIVEGRKVGAVSLLLIGLINPNADGKTGSLAERGFNSDRFRPLDELKAEASESAESVSESELVEV